MKERILYIAWAMLYAICAALGFYGEAEGFGKVLFVATAVIFFLPGIGLVVLGHREGDKKILRRVRIISASVLALTLIFLIANVAVAAITETTNKLLHVFLALVSAPMLCGQYWALSLFLWACLLFATFVNLPDKK